ncbi:MAG: phosphotransferase [bacterium]|nr:phosphotransferase [bacterium]
MLEAVHEALDGHFGGAAGRELRIDDCLCLDVTHGAIDGYCYLFFGHDGELPRVVAKAARTPAGARVLEIELENLRRLHTAGMNDGMPRIPEPLHALRTDEVVVTLQTALAGTLLKNVPGPELFSPAAAAGTFDAIFDWWRSFERCAGVRRTTIDEPTYAERVLAGVGRFERRYLLDDAEREFLHATFRERRDLLGLDVPLMPRHGDLCTANMVRQPEGIGVFDWEFPLEDHLPLFDLFYLFSSLRHPYGGSRGESDHFTSFKDVFWGDGHLSRELRGRAKGFCTEHGLAEAAVADLFVLALIDVANLKFEALLESRGIAEDDLDADRRAAWDGLGPVEQNVPFARISSGVFENLRHVVRHGAPRLLD